MSRAERRRAMRTGHMTVLDRPPVFCDLRPLSVAELLPGETMTPGMVMFTARGSGEDGLPGEMFFELALALPAHERANTGPNVRRVIEKLRQASEFRNLMAKYYWYLPTAGEPAFGVATQSI
ncbi:hypothetical protein [Mesorhizobium huakuii]|uniref:hypothetical protein n=1 Tax=Mesorhizobium huakuii TaxID=28104 RepID=UPI0024E13125|nr:hypothetical protein [Mesorhizobium huakuii]